MDQIVNEFNEQSGSDYTINHVITFDMYTKLSTVVSSKSGIPDLTLMHSYKVEEFVNSDIIDPVDRLVSYQPELEEQLFRYGVEWENRRYSIYNPIRYSCQCHVLQSRSFRKIQCHFLVRLITS